MSRPVWVDWRQKKHLALGFCIFEADISAQLLSVDSFGGFVLIRLTSCGKLEAQPYHAAWEPEKFQGHKRKSADMEENRLHDAMELEYEGVKKMQHIDLSFLEAFFRGNLEKCIVSRREKIEESDEGAGSRKEHLDNSDRNFHKEMCHKLKNLGPLEARSFVGISAALGGISWPTSVHEIGLMGVFAALPVGLLPSAFAVYSDFDVDHGNEPLEFLDIPDQPQAPPFHFRRPSFRSNQWSTKVQPPDALVGPVIPPLFLTALYRLLVEERKSKRELYLEESEAFSTHVQFKSQCEKVMEAVREHIAENREDDYVSLADDIESMASLTQKSKFSFYKPSAFSESPPCVEKWEPGPRSCIFSTHVFGRSEFMESDNGLEIVGKELFDAGCPIRLKFEDFNTDFGPKELETLRNLKQQDMDFQRSFKPYQESIKSAVEIPRDSVLKSALAGGLSCALSASIMHPVDPIKVTSAALGELFQAVRAIMGWLSDCAKVIASENEPVRWTTPLGLPVAQPYFKSRLCAVVQRIIGRELQPWKTVAVGALLTAVLTTPIDVIKTRMMVASHEQTAKVSFIAISILRQEADRAFQRGRPSDLLGRVTWRHELFRL
ncbi:Unknown protein [Striga hermonthica]|uniref:DNA-directed RNA polymerase C-terminal domain-containing protein n=1 Tax=Striga hermonthica TaxID=68872 RepID=A0A9N7N396_STRHE|nr:Unknown protein [Striga hermonthica]